MAGDGAGVDEDGISAAAQVVADGVGKRTAMLGIAVAPEHDGDLVTAGGNEGGKEIGVADVPGEDDQVEAVGADEVRPLRLGEEAVRQEMAGGGGDDGGTAEVRDFALAGSEVAGEEGEFDAGGIGETLENRGAIGGETGLANRNFDAHANLLVSV